MVFSSFVRTPDMVSVVFTDTCIRAVLRKSEQDLHFHSLMERKLPEGVIEGGEVKERETLLAILSSIVEEEKWKRKNVQFLVPNPFVVIRKLTLPEDVLADEMRGYLFMEIGSSIHLPFEEPVFDFVKLEQSETNDILFFAAPLDIVKDYQDILQEAGLKPKQAEVSALSLYRYFSHEQLVTSEEHAMILSIDESEATVSIFHEDIPVFMRPIELTFEDEFIESDMGNVDLSVKMATIFKEFEKVMNFYRYTVHKGDSQITKLLFTGDHPRLHEIATYFSQQVELPYVLMNRESVTSENDMVATDAFVSVIGLALKGGK